MPRNMAPKNIDPETGETRVIVLELTSFLAPHKKMWVALDEHTADQLEYLLSMPIDIQSEMRRYLTEHLDNSKLLEESLRDFGSKLRNIAARLERGTVTFRLATDEEIAKEKARTYEGKNALV